MYCMLTYHAGDATRAKEAFTARLAINRSNRYLFLVTVNVHFLVGFAAPSGLTSINP